jgi:hypothetical protein
MFEYLKALAARLTRQGFGGWPPLPPSEDPYAGVREPRRRGPGGKSTALAIAEPDEQISTRAYGKPR